MDIASLRDGFRGYLAFFNALGFNAGWMAVRVWRAFSRKDGKVNIYHKRKPGFGSPFLQILQDLLLHILHRFPVKRLNSFLHLGSICGNMILSEIVGETYWLPVSLFKTHSLILWIKKSLKNLEIFRFIRVFLGKKISNLQLVEFFRSTSFLSNILKTVARREKGVVYKIKAY